MRRSSSAQTSGFSLIRPTLSHVYVEGARDGEILRGWIQRRSPAFARSLGRALVILGGRRPQRARDHLDALREHEPEASGLCILDLDGGEATVPPGDGLEAFSWSRRHIESYLLVPAALRRSRRIEPAQAELFERLLVEHVPAADDPAWRTLDAKRLLGKKGPFAKELGVAFAPGRVARAMRPDELHDDVHRLLGRLAQGLGFSLDGPEVAIRRAR